MLKTAKKKKRANRNHIIDYVVDLNRGRGRPNSYNPIKYPDQVRQLCQYGATDTELAEFFKVSVSAFYKWQALYPDFKEAVRLGKEASDSRVVRSLYQKAVGYYQRELKGHKYHPADVAAQKMWLTNRLPKEWRDRIDVTQHDASTEMTAAQARDSLIEFLIQHGVPIEPPLVIEGKVDDKDQDKGKDQ